MNVFGSRPRRLETLAERDVLLELVGRRQVVLAEELEDHVVVDAGEILGRQRPVAVRAGEAVGVDLPARSRVLRLRLDDRDVGVTVRAVGRRAPEQEQVLGQAEAHLRPVLALLGPAEAIGLVVLPDDVGDDRLHPEEREAVPGVVGDRLGVERLDRLEAEPGHSARHDPVLDVDRGDPAGLEYSEELGRQEVHLRPEVGVVVGVAEVVVGRACTRTASRTGCW
jgi:hypothetical protein